MRSFSEQVFLETRFGRIGEAKRSVYRQRRHKVMWKPTLKQARRVVIAVVGFTLVLAGVVMIVTPGPGWLTILLGLSVLGVEFVWARRLLKRLKQHGSELGKKVLGKSASPKQPEPNQLRKSEQVKE